MSKIERREQKLKRAFEKAIASTQQEIEKKQHEIQEARQLIKRLLDEVEQLGVQKAELLTDYNEFIDTLDDEE